MSDAEDATRIDANASADETGRAFGPWNTEGDSAAEFDRRVQESGLFERVFVEVRGYYMTHRPNRQGRDARIDRFLIPGKKLRDAGWTRDIGVEIKRSGEKIGPALAQAIDYTYCVFNVGSHWMVPEHIFLWPFQRQHRASESLMLQNAVGVIFEQKSAGLVFQLEKQVIRAERDGSVSVQMPNSGTKVGSR